MPKEQIKAVQAEDIQVVKRGYSRTAESGRAVTHTKQSARTLAYYANFLALALILSYLESLIPMPVPIPGIKLGLTNIVSLLLLYRNGFLPAATVNMGRIVLSNMLFGNPLSFAYAMAGGLFSLLIMALFKKINFFSVTGVSILGGVFHNIGQIFTAMLILRTGSLYYYLPFMLISGAIAGCLVGILCSFLKKGMRRVRLT